MLSLSVPGHFPLAHLHYQLGGERPLLRRHGRQAAPRAAGRRPDRRRAGEGRTGLRRRVRRRVRHLPAGDRGGAGRARRLDGPGRAGVQFIRHFSFVPNHVCGFETLHR